MRFTVRQQDGPAQEYRVHDNPIHVGRGESNQIVLPGRTVSKQHAIVFSTDDGAWMLEDLDSANKTFLNGKAIHRARITTGDIITITDFTIEIAMVDVEPEEKVDEAEDTLQLEATLSTPRNETVVRKPDSSHAPAMRLPAKRLMDFAQATDTISSAQDIEELLLALIDTVLKQFSGFHVWCALREQPSGPMTYHAGKRRDGQSVEIDELALSDKINHAVERKQSLVLPRVSAQMEGTDRIRSAIITSIVGHAGCYGVIYVDNAMIHEHFSLSDLDYLMFVAIHTSAVLKRLLTD